MHFGEFFGILVVTTTWACLAWYTLGRYRDNDPSRWLDISEAERRFRDRNDDA